MRTAVIGAGAWGTALSTVLVKNGHETALWCYRAQRAREIEKTRVNPRLPGICLPQDLQITADPQCVRGCKLVVIACPSSPIRSVCRTVAPYLDEDAVMVSVTKGIEP